MAYGDPIPGFDTYSSNFPRMWLDLPAEEFSFEAFDDFRYAEVAILHLNAEDLCAGCARIKTSIRARYGG